VALTSAGTATEQVTDPFAVAVFGRLRWLYACTWEFRALSAPFKTGGE
jgi:hypothetical protein